MNIYAAACLTVYISGAACVLWAMLTNNDEALARLWRLADRLRESALCLWIPERVWFWLPLAGVCLLNLIGGVGVGLLAPLRH